jgi:hypothetical protein
MMMDLRGINHGSWKGTASVAEPEPKVNYLLEPERIYELRLWLQLRILSTYQRLEEIL